MAKTATQVNFTTIRGGRHSLAPADTLEARAEHWINAKIEEGWSLRDIFCVGEDSAHIVMTRKDAVA